MKTTLDTIAMVLLTSLLAVSASIATAATVTVTAPGSTAGVRYTSGGASPDGLARMHAMEGDYDLLIHFVASAGEDDYQGLRVSVLDGSGKQVLSSAAGGPLFYAQVPSGRYEVTAEFHGKKTTRGITVDPGHTARLEFELPN